MVTMAAAVTSAVGHDLLAGSLVHSGYHSGGGANKGAKPRLIATTPSRRAGPTKNPAEPRLIATTLSLVEDICAYGLRESPPVVPESISSGDRHPPMSDVLADTPAESALDRENDPCSTDSYPCDR